jgi:hypothetical protein
MERKDCGKREEGNVLVGSTFALATALMVFAFS